jgi:hypothetical protein
VRLLRLLETVLPFRVGLGLLLHSQQQHVSCLRASITKSHEGRQNRHDGQENLQSGMATAATTGAEALNLSDWGRIAAGT